VLLVHVQDPDPEAARLAADALRAELSLRGLAGEVTVETGAPGPAPAGAIVVDAAAPTRIAAEIVLAGLAGHATGGARGIYSSDEEEEVRRRLEDLGYL
jgi:hypothetical protein